MRLGKGTHAQEDVTAGERSTSRASTAPLRVLTIQCGISLVAPLVRTDSLRYRVQNFVDAVA